MDILELRGGIIASVKDLTFLWGLENQGMAFRVDGASLRIAGANNQKPDLSAEDVAFIKARKPHLCALVGYQPPS
jgi:hypothetical protein